MSPRISYTAFGQHAAAARTGLTALSRTALELGLDQALCELVKLRVSQINGCAFCLAYHLKLLRRLKVGQDRLDQLAAWREAEIFSPAERAALAFAEEMTRIAMALPDGRSYEALGAYFSEKQIVGLGLVVAEINAWNRMAVAFHFSPSDA